MRNTGGGGGGGGGGAGAKTSLCEMLEPLNLGDQARGEEVPTRSAVGPPAAAEAGGEVLGAPSIGVQARPRGPPKVLSVGCCTKEAKRRSTRRSSVSGEAKAGASLDAQARARTTSGCARGMPFLKT
ncbi:unnamed protein product [Prorocentrum cordatum]|uniref:Uncharacterized protein n=1 Tax=Prorocentrum cordatum TaxID=2364126 RepID=A0ABN9WDJ9_9DINO|nr:unnamed protein product [Polarella glacialis]